MTTCLLNAVTAIRDDSEYCSRGRNRKNTLLPPELKDKYLKLGKGKYGTVTGDGEFAIKKMELSWDDVDFLNSEIAFTIAFSDLNIV